MNKSILKLKYDNCNIEELTNLIGQTFEIKWYGISWGKKIVSADKITITGIHYTGLIDRKGKNSISCLLIYSDYYLNGEFLYNANTDLGSIQSRIINHIKETKA